MMYEGMTLHHGSGADIIGMKYFKNLGPMQFYRLMSFIQHERLTYVSIHGHVLS